MTLRSGEVALDLSCPDWFERLQAGKTPIPDLPLNEAQADKAVGIFDRLRLPDVPGQPLMREAAGDWNRDVLRAIFGSVETDAMGVVISRTIRYFMELVPKKNAKTTNGAAIMLTALLMNKRPRADYLLVGPTQETADLAFSQAVGMIEADEEGYLQKRFQVQEHKKTIVDRHNKAKLKIKTFDNKVMTGSKPVGVLIEELHELGKFHYAAKVLTQIRGGIIANPEGFIIYITTQSDEPPTGVFRMELDYARDIRDGKVAGDMLPILYEFPIAMQADETMPWKNKANWPLVLPNLGRSIHLESIDRLLIAAESKGAEEVALCASQHLNVEVGIALHRDRWAGVEYWLGAKDPEPITLESIVERCDVAVAGIDGGGLDDLLGLSICGRDRITKDWLFWYRAWAHKIVFERRKDIADKLQQFARDGSLIICEHPTQDIEELVGVIDTIHQAGLFPEKYGIGLDPVGVAAITDEIAGRGIDPELMVAVPQGYKLSGTIKGFERKLMDGTIWHDGSPMMIWCAGNAKAEVRGSATLITKQVSGTAKIDPLLAGFNAFSLMSRNPVAAQVMTSPWDDPSFSLVPS